MNQVKYYPLKISKGVSDIKYDILYYICMEIVFIVDHETVAEMMERLRF